MVEKFAFGVARDDRKQLDKIRRRLYGKGFSIDRINAAIEEYFAEHEEESILKCKIGFVSLGCPKNLTDTETMIGLLQDDCEIVQDRPRPRSL